MALCVVANFLGHFSPNQIINLPTWRLHHHISHTYTHTCRAMLSKYVCDGQESTRSDPGMCCVDVKTSDMGGQRSAPVFPSTAPTPPCSALIRPGQGAFCPRKGQKGCMAGTKAPQVPPRRLTWASWHPSSWCALQTPASETPPGAPTRRAESPGKPHPSCESTHHACRPWTCLGTRRAEVRRRCRAAPTGAWAQNSGCKGDTDPAEAPGTLLCSFPPRQKSPSAAPRPRT